MESTTSSRSILVAVLAGAVVILTAINIFQDHVINAQRFELRWLMTHSIIRPDVPMDAAAKSAIDGAARDAAKSPAASVAALPQSEKPAAPAPTAKP